MRGQCFHAGHAPPSPIGAHLLRRDCFDSGWTLPRIWYSVGRLGIMGVPTPNLLLREDLQSYLTEFLPLPLTPGDQR